MHSFSFDISTLKKRFLRKQLFSIIVLLTPFIADQFYDFDFIRPAYIYSVVACLFVLITTDLGNDHVYKIDFDEDQKIVKLYSKTAFGKIKHCTLSFSDIRLNIYSKKRRGKRKIYLIDIMQGKRNVASLYDRKNGFTANQLYYLYKAADDLKIGNNLS